MSRLSIPNNAARDCSKCDGQLVPTPGEAPFLDEGDGGANVGLRCNKGCGLESVHYWTASDREYQDYFGHAFGEFGE